MEEPLLTDAIRAYAAALGVADPIRTQFWDERGLTMTQLRMVCMLYPDQKRTVSGLAEEMHVRPPTITGLADRLIKHGFVQRLHGKDDRRLVLVELTDEGRHVLDDLAAAGSAYLAKVFARMGEHRVRQFTEVMDLFAESAEAVERDEMAVGA